MTKDNDGSRSTPFALMRTLRKRRYYLLLPVLVLVPAIAFYVLRLPPRFRARALVASDPNQAHLTFGRTDAANVLSAQDLLRTVQVTILGQTALESINQEFNLYPTEAGHLSQKTTEKMKNAIQIQVEGGEAFYVGFEGRSAQEARAVANRLASMFVDHTSVVHTRQATQEDSFLDAEVARMRDQLAQQDDRIKSYQLGGAQAMPERLTSNLKQLEILQTEVQSKTDQITAAEANQSADRAELSALEKQGVLDPEPKQETAADLALTDARRKLSQLQARYMPDHPEVVRAQKDVHDLETAAAQPAPVVHHQPSAIQLRYIALQAEMKALDQRLSSYHQEKDAAMAQLKTYERVVDASPGVETAVSERVKDAAATRASYEALLAKQQDARLNHQVEKIDDGTSYKVVEPAQLPSEPYSPHPVRLILLGLAGSFGLGIAGVVFAERMDTTFETGEQFEQATGIAVLSTIPSISSKEMNADGGDFANSIKYVSDGTDRSTWQHLQKHRIAVLTHPEGVATQQYKLLSLKVQRWMEKTGGRILAITSSTGEEGKSMTALNLSLALASSLEGGVLLIDCDLRLPQVHERLGLSREDGLADMLVQRDADPTNFISKVGKLDVIHAGSRSRERVDLLNSARTRDIFSQLRKHYQLIILDCPPVVPIADSVALAGLADGVAMVVRARSTRPELFQRAIDSLDARNFVGVVLNDVELSATPYAYAYRYYQQHYVDRN